MKGKFPIEKFGNTQTPFYYYDTQLLKATLEAIQTQTQQCNNWKVHYAVKANANPKILKTIAQSGLGADCVSGGEIKACLAAGFPAHEIVFAGVGKSDWEINLGLEQGIAYFNVESIPELEVINELAAAQHTIARVSFRINPNVDAHTHAHITTGLPDNKFGIAMQDMEKVIAIAGEMKQIEFVGLHFHIGSQILDMADFIALSHRINELQDKLEKLHITVKHINVGGGLGVDYKQPNEHAVPNFSDFFAVYRNHLKLRPGQELHFELGRAVIAQCGSLITRLLYVKTGANKQFAIVDAGMTDLIRPALYAAYHCIENLSSDQPESTYDVVGPICESSDVFAKDYPLNQCHRGDLIALRSAGAYGEVMASSYNCRPLPIGYLSEDFS